MSDLNALFNIDSSGRRFYETKKDRIFLYVYPADHFNSAQSGSEGSFQAKDHGTLLNDLLPYFPDPYGADQSFNNMTNSFFITVLCIGISIILYRNRVWSEYARIIIGEQYQKIAEINQKLNQQVIRDRLTGLFNRSYLETSLREQFQSVQEKHGNIACMMIDIDSINYFLSKCSPVYFFYDTM